MVMESREPVLLESTHSHSTIKENGIATTLVKSMEEGRGYVPMVTQNTREFENLIVRRLTPKECARLQGYPDDWMDIGEWKDQKGKIHQEADAPKYKAAGNSIALPFWQWLMFRIYEQLKKDGIENPTMASLFDGIGGFPLTASRANIKPLWASEIEDFPIAVTKERFKEVDA